MRKKVIVVNGTMGVGKSAVCRKLYGSIDKSVWLDGDWCWMINPLIVNDENRIMAEENIKTLLRNFLKNSSIENVIFSWVIHTEEIMEMVIGWLGDVDYDLYKVTLTCSKEKLIERISKDIENGLRDDDVLERSLERMDLYKNLDTIKINTNEKTINDIVAEVKSVTSQ